MKEFFVRMKHQLNIPVESAEVVKVLRNCKVVLKDSEGMSWHVTVHDNSARTDPRFYPYLGKGWCEFVEKNKLVEGDRCIFDFESRERGILNIRVFNSKHSFALEGTLDMIMLVTMNMNILFVRGVGKKQKKRVSSDVMCEP